MQRKQITNFKNEKRNIVTDLIDIKEITRKYYEKCLSVKRSNLDDMDKFLKKKFVKSHSNTALIYHISVKEIALEIKNLSLTPGPDGLIIKCCQTCK